jgi:putative PIN family toxin of toxin-antitoxin system
VIVVLDTNILARGAISRATAVSAIIDAWIAGEFTLATSTHILAELGRVLQKPHFSQRLSSTTVAAYQQLLTTQATLVPITAQVSGVATHPEDDLVLATAVSARADYLVTRDRQLLRLGSYQGVTVLSPTEFLQALTTQP